MKNLRKVIQTKLKTLHPRVYFQVAPSDAVTPYITYDFTDIPADGEGFEQAAIDIDGWDIPANGDTTVLEDLMQAINDSLNKATLTGTDLAVMLYLDRKIPVIDNDPRIKRRKYVYQARIFGRS